MNPADPHSPRRVVTLPGGKTIEVVYFQELPRTGARAGLHVCPECCGELVHPVQWDESGRDRWEVTLRCPSCEWIATDVYDQGQVDELEDRLDDGMRELARSLERLEREHMEQDVDRFAAALLAGQILPEDF